jgi:LmbE family N-acetylglucosaminyl deacetylase
VSSPDHGAPAAPATSTPIGAPPAAPRGLLAIFAHPDDETFGAGGTMALVAAAGVPTWIVCATDGDLGGEDGARDLDPELRRGELRCAMRAFGVAEPIFLGYGDSGMEGWAKPAGCLALADADEVVERLVAIIGELRPATIVTFDPGGIYGHPDHVAISAHATAAFRRAAAEPGGPTTLYHQAISRSDLEQWGEMQAQWAALGGDEGAEPKEPTADDLLQQQRFVELARPDEDVTTEVDVRPVLDRKLAAFACHASQVRQDWSAAPREMLERWMGRETFIRVEPPPLPGERETALRGVV